MLVSFFEFSQPTDVFCSIDGNNLNIEVIGVNEITLSSNGKKKYYHNKELKKKASMIKPGDYLSTYNK